MWKVICSSCSLIAFILNLVVCCTVIFFLFFRCSKCRVWDNVKKIVLWRRQLNQLIEGNVSFGEEYRMGSSGWMCVRISTSALCGIIFGFAVEKGRGIVCPFCLPICMPVSLCYPFVCIYAPSSIMNFYITPNTDSSTLAMADTHQSACVLTSLYKTMFNQSINLFKKCLFIQSVS